MALLSFNPLPSLSSPVSSCSTSLPIAGLPVPRLRLKSFDHLNPSKCSIGAQFVPNAKIMVMTVKASSASTDGEPQPPEESKKEALPVEQLPLESKMQQMMEQKMKMKLAKKIRLRRKRLVRKRKMRKKGRWPPSKMKKLKNMVVTVVVLMVVPEEEKDDSCNYIDTNRDVHMRVDGEVQMNNNGVAPWLSRIILPVVMVAVRSLKGYKTSFCFSLSLCLKTSLSTPYNGKEKEKP
ncbi:hypothetical protein PTKIN_Ptkin10aG0009300 [Pterospermum kingtungense]